MKDVYLPLLDGEDSFHIDVVESRRWLQWGFALLALGACCLAILSGTFLGISVGTSTRTRTDSVDLSEQADIGDDFDFFKSDFFPTLEPTSTSTTTTSTEATTQRTTLKPQFKAIGVKEQDEEMARKVKGKGETPFNVALAEALKDCAQSGVLDMSVTRMNDIGAKMLADALPELKDHLQSLCLHANTIGSEGAEALAVAISMCPELEALDLKSNQLGDAGAMAIATGITGLSKLRNVKLNGNQIGVEGGKALIKAFCSCPNLAYIYLGANDIGDAGALALEPVLAKIRNLRILGLDRNRIGCIGALSIGMALPSCHNLEKLDLNFNLIKNETVDLLYQLLPSCRKLTEIRVDRQQEYAEPVEPREAPQPRQPRRPAWMAGPGVTQLAPGLAPVRSTNQAVGDRPDFLAMDRAYELQQQAAKQRGEVGVGGVRIAKPAAQFPTGQQPMMAEQRPGLKESSFKEDDFPSMKQEDFPSLGGLAAFPTQPPVANPFGGAHPFGAQDPQSPSGQLR